MPPRRAREGRRADQPYPILERLGDLSVSPEVGPRKRSLATLDGLSGEAGGEAQDGFDGPRPACNGGPAGDLLEALGITQAVEGGAV